MKVVVRFDGDKFCVMKIENGKEIESRCMSEPLQVIARTEVVIEGFREGPGFLVTCVNCEYFIEGKAIVLNKAPTS